MSAGWYWRDNNWNFQHDCLNLLSESVRLKMESGITPENPKLCSVQLSQKIYFSYIWHNSPNQKKDIPANINSNEKVIFVGESCETWDSMLVNALCKYLSRCEVNGNRNRENMLGEREREPLNCNPESLLQNNSS